MFDYVIKQKPLLFLLCFCVLLLFWFALFFARTARSMLHLNQSIVKINLKNNLPRPVHWKSSKILELKRKQQHVLKCHLHPHIKNYFAIISLRLRVILLNVYVYIHTCILNYQYKNFTLLWSLTIFLITGIFWLRGFCFVSNISILMY